MRRSRCRRGAEGGQIRREPGDSDCACQACAQSSVWLRKLFAVSRLEQIADSPAVRIHDEQADRFQDHYATLANGHYANTFVYKRKFILDFCDRNLAGLAGPILDIGCGTGHLLQRYKDRGIATVGCDPSNEMLGHASRHQELVALARAS